MDNNESIGTIAEALVSELLAAGKTASTAESCTGGWIAKVCTDLAGSSHWFERGIVSYSNAAKSELLQVGQHVLEQHGAVSRETAEAMALGVLAASRAQLSLAVTGIAGPDGGTDDKPVGSVWFAWAGDGQCRSELRQFNGSREQVRLQTVEYALLGLDRFVDEL